MIVKTYEIENTYLKIKDQNICLFYGENLGLINDLKREIKNNNKMNKVINLNQDDILKTLKFFITILLTCHYLTKKKFTLLIK